MLDMQTAADFSVRRAHAMQQSAYALRQQALNGGSIEGWRLARRMRDATTLKQLSAVETELGLYLRSTSLDPLETA
jgi:hypothetical protein